MDNYLASFYLLTHLGGNNIRATGVRKYTIKGDKQLQKRNVVTLNSSEHVKQKGSVTCVVGTTTAVGFT